MRLSAGLSPGRRPRLSILAASWLGSVLVLGSGVAVVHGGYSPLDDPNPAYQRPSFVDANPPRSVAPRLPGIRRPSGTRGVVFFTRPELLSRLLFSLASADGATVGRHAQIIVVVQESAADAPSVAPTGVELLTDPAGELSRAFHMRTPRDHGYPVGYAVIGPDGTIRYRTEDPGQDHRLSEVLVAVVNL